jgi:hypothetical protein
VNFQQIAELTTKAIEELASYFRRKKNALSDPGRLTFHAAGMVFGGDFALVRSRARSEWTLPA